jgi:hypothetical protein
MNGRSLIGVLLLAAGLLALAYGGFTYTRTTHDAKIGPFEVAVKDKEHVNVPVWAGAALAVVGGVLLVSKERSR